MTVLNVGKDDDLLLLPPSRLTYTRDQLLSLPPATLDPSVADDIRGAGIGYHLPHIRTHRAGRRKQRGISVVCGSVRGLSDCGERSGVNFDNLIRVPIVACFDTVPSADLCVTSFNAQSVGRKEKRSAINEYILSNDVDIMCVTETWLREAGDEAKCRDLAPPGYTTSSFPRSTATRGGGIAFVVSDKLRPHIKLTSDFPFSHSTFELAQLTLSFQQRVVNILTVYRPPPSKKNKFTDAKFLEQLPDFLEYANNLPGSLLIVGDFNYHFDTPSHFYTSKVLDVLNMFDLCQSVSEPTHVRGHIVDWVVFREEDGLVKSTSVEPSLSSDHYCVTCTLDFAKPPSPRVYREVRRLASMDVEAFKADFLADLPSLPSAEQLFRVLRAILDTHAPSTRRLVSNRPPSPWYSGVGPELQDAKRERRGAERQWRATGLTVHRQVFQAARNRVIAIVDHAKSAFFSSKILACTSVKQLFSVTNDILGKVTCPPLPTMFSVHELPQKFADFFTAKIALIREKLDSAVVPPSPVADRMYCGPALQRFEPVTSEFVKKQEMIIDCNAWSSTRHYQLVTQCSATFRWQSEVTLEQHCP
ncbi:uncharacterized protein [Littorina saxatilis]|uniref:uncharacterized protein n=1 Tax=Littorina saxatilis TaxID=31220 RepID=UPI0038B5ECDD